MLDVYLIFLLMILVIVAVRIVTEYRISLPRATTPPQPAPRSDVAEISCGRCPDCGSEALIAGPSGGMSQNVGCNSCLMEFNVHYGFGGVFSIDRTGKMSRSRAGIFGISPEEYDGIVV